LFFKKFPWVRHGLAIDIDLIRRSTTTSRNWQSCRRRLAAEKISVNSPGKPQKHILTWRGFVESAPGYTQGRSLLILLPPKTSWSWPNSLPGLRGTSAVPFQDESGPCASFDEINNTL
jgi:hypothetical protein